MNDRRRLLNMAAFTVDAALGGPMQHGSLLNSRPIYGLRWYGFGNVTFAVYATSGLLFAGYLAHRIEGKASLRAIQASMGIIAICPSGESSAVSIKAMKRASTTPPVTRAVHSCRP